MAMASYFDPARDEIEGIGTFCKKRRRLQPCYRCRKVYYCTKAGRLNHVPRHEDGCGVAKHRDDERSVTNGQTMAVRADDTANPRQKSNLPPPSAPHHHSPRSD